MKNFIHPILSGIIASMATLVGEQCFSLPDYTVHHIGKLVFGLVAFLLLNQLMYRFQFNSYQLNGATISTLIIFLTQNIVIGLSRPTQLSYRWWIGVTLICSGVYVLYKQRQSHRPINKQL